MSLSGGLWYYTDHLRPNQAAGIYDNVTSNDNKDRMAFGDFPMPDDYPTYLTHDRYYEYLTSYAKHFDLLRHIQCNQTVTKVRQTKDYITTGQWEVFTRATDGGKEEQHVFDAVCICSGAFTRGRIPDLPELADFKGENVTIALWWIQNLLHSIDISVVYEQ